ncbi:ATP-grasp domain-containing protein [Lichenifustis flavocetrariae]|uniref:ATP-grasp domain-containing protein n=1 Tax=Lichenifustis flavocetrariae TaxID=2949735 RepID=A0AA42CJ43_9HYPH|nr:ATP-grasp domain-containing protein [Lichenifustis flavocetrariae]MCW6509049.1 ATP-grasp domain-containing protein [Lichenifustis flavocetrariae]
MTRNTPTLLVATTTWWPSVAVLASSLERAGFAVVVLCPQGHVAHAATRFNSIVLDNHHPRLALAAAIKAVSPSLVVPGDDRAVSHLLQLHQKGDADLKDIVTRSVGPASCHEVLTARVPLLRAAKKAGIPVPIFRQLPTLADLDLWIAETPPPWVLKVDRAWGGEGVRVVQTPDAARRAFVDLTRGLSLGMALKRRVINGDPHWLQERHDRSARLVSAQAFVSGRPGSCAVFARDGEVLGATVVEAESSCGGQGPSTLVRSVERPGFVEGVQRLVAELGFSGFLGFDFMVDDRSDAALLIEMNPRITAPCRMRGPYKPHPVAAAARAFACQPHERPQPPRTRFASFPLAWLGDPFAAELAACQDDVPWHEPRLVEECLKPLWPERGGLAALPGRVRRALDLLKTGTSPLDYRTKPLAWWRAQGVLRPPLSDET